jgi:hypothetical protein
MKDVQAQLFRIIDGCLPVRKLDPRFGSFQPGQSDAVLFFVETVSANFEAEVGSAFIMVTMLRRIWLEKAVVEVVCKVETVLFPGLR